MTKVRLLCKICVVLLHMLFGNSITVDSSQNATADVIFYRKVPFLRLV
jgi:hypothetical protein